MLRTTDNPPPLSVGLTRPADAQGTWWVAHSKPRAEKALAWDLAAKRVAYYLPMATRTLRSGGRRRKSMIPLFASYVFFCGDEKHRADVLATGRVVQLLPVRQQGQFVAELESLHQALAADAELKLYPFAVVGRRVRVSKGPLQGTEGVLLQTDDVTRLVLQIAVLGQGAALEIDAAFLEPAD